MSGFKLILIFISILLLFKSISANILFDETVPEEIMKEISRLYRENNLDASFLIEMHNQNELLIISQDGYMRKLPLAEVTGRDVFNVMEIMINYIPTKKEKDEFDIFSQTQFIELEKRLLKEKKEEKEERTYLTGGIKVNENTEFFPWCTTGSRFSTSLYVSSQERWAGGFRFSAGAAFLKLGFNFKKGSNIVFENNQSIAWEAYGLFLMIDIFRYRGFHFLSGFKVELYDTRGKLFEREFFIFSLSHRLKWFEMGGSFNISPSNVELGLFGQKYRMEQWNFVIFAGFLF